MLLALTKNQRKVIDDKINSILKSLGIDMQKSMDEIKREIEERKIRIVPNQSPIEIKNDNGNLIYTAKIEYEVYENDKRIL